MSFQNKDLICRDCNKTFVFSAGEQEFFSAKGLVNEPKRCPNCRILMRVQRNGEDPSRTAEVNCAECGSPTRVPFQPKGYRPVYCSSCFRSKKHEVQVQAAETQEAVDPEIARVS
ncbi:MAG: zinc-binding protein [Candidatus Melainabacteria bacterium]|nr:MAG: zinc-binding protein [Candidatus Melainabacteria bacterium]